MKIGSYDLKKKIVSEAACTILYQEQIFHILNKPINRIFFFLNKNYMKQKAKELPVLIVVTEYIRPLLTLVKVLSYPEVETGSIEIRRIL